MYDNTETMEKTKVHFFQVSIWYGAVVRGDCNQVKFGPRARAFVEKNEHDTKERMNEKGHTDESVALRSRASQRSSVEDGWIDRGVSLTELSLWWGSLPAAVFEAQRTDRCAEILQEARESRN